MYNCQQQQPSLFDLCHPPPVRVIVPGPVNPPIPPQPNPPQPVIPYPPVIIPPAPMVDTVRHVIGAARFDTTGIVVPNNTTRIPYPTEWYDPQNIWRSSTADPNREDAYFVPETGIYTFTFSDDVLNEQSIPDQFLRLEIASYRFNEPPGCFTIRIWARRDINIAVGERINTSLTSTMPLTAGDFVVLQAIPSSSIQVSNPPPVYRLFNGNVSASRLPVPYTPPIDQPDLSVVCSPIAG